MKNKQPITVQTIVNTSLEKAWDTWVTPSHIEQWNTASNEWHTPKAINNLKVGGRFVSRMEAKDGSMGFDFSGVYTKVKPRKHLAYTLDDNRKVIVNFEKNNQGVLITETFEPEQQNSIDKQRDGWQAILNNFKKYIETEQ